MRDVGRTSWCCSLIMKPNDRNTLNCHIDCSLRQSFCFINTQRLRARLLWSSIHRCDYRYIDATITSIASTVFLFYNHTTSTTYTSSLVVIIDTSMRSSIHRLLRQSLCFIITQRLRGLRARLLRSSIHRCDHRYIDCCDPYTIVSWWRFWTPPLPPPPSHLKILTNRLCLMISI